MSSFDFCNKCSKYHYLDKSCGPHFRVWDSEWDGDEADAVTIHALDAQGAAEIYAERRDQQGDFDIVGGSPVDVNVRDADGNVGVWRVHGEPMPAYSASQIASRGDV